MGTVTQTFMLETSAIDAQLAGVLRAILKGEAAAWPERGWNSGEELSAIWARIEYHGIPVLLHERANLLAGWPSKMLERIAEEARLIGLWEATHAASIAKLVGALDAAGIEAVLMKGTAIAYSLYDEPAARRRGDSDLLIRPADLDRTRTTLSECGWYRNDDPHGLVYQEGWLCEAGHFVHALDLHWETSDRPVLQQVLAAEDFFAEKHLLPRLAPHAYRADHALTLIHETLNQKWHEAHGYWAEGGRVKGGRRLIWSVDFDLVARSLDDQDWERLALLCEQRGVGSLVADALRGAAGDFGTPLPQEVLGRLGARPTDPDVAAYFATSDSLGEFWLDLRTARSWRQRVEMIRDRGLPPRAHLVEKYPRQSGWPTALLQGRLLVETAGRMIKRAVS